MKITTRHASNEQDHAAQLGGVRFVLLTTYRASGESVATAVWVVPDADQVAILTNADSGKVRRLQHNRAVTLVPCNPRGAPNPKATPVLGHAEVLADPDAVAR
ncbi:MAG: pyridoxamine 5'-phosphate oxidase family protein, partial [Antricoccus sp.]